jgi:hypothetical protein
MGVRQPARVVFLDRDTLSPETRLRDPAFPHRMQVFAKTAPAEVAERIRDADIVITNKAAHARCDRGGEKSSACCSRRDWNRCC